MLTHSGLCGPTVFGSRLLHLGLLCLHQGLDGGGLWGGEHHCNDDDNQHHNLCYDHHQDHDNHLDNDQMDPAARQCLPGCSAHGSIQPGSNVCTCDPGWTGEFLDYDDFHADEDGRYDHHDHGNDDDDNDFN